MNKKIHQIIIFLFLSVCTNEVIADDKVTLTKELIESLENDPAKDSGFINGEKYITSLENGNVLIVAKVNTKKEYEPIALANIEGLEKPSAWIRNNTINVHSGGAHHGIYDRNFVFKLRKNTFYLSKFRAASNSSEDYNDPSVQLMQVTTANFDESTIHEWKRRFVIYKNIKNKSEINDSDEYKPGMKAWEKSMDRMKNELPMLGGKNKTVKSKKIYLLNGINFDDVLIDIDRLTNPSSSGTPNGALTSNVRIQN